MAFPEHIDVAIVGAGLSGVGVACRLQIECPDKSFALFEARATSGGTWDLFRYPGVRSDSDIFTLAYSFRPWKGSKAIADGPSILRYIRETARDRGIEERIRYHRRVRAARWSSAEARWTLEVEDTESGRTEVVSCAFLFGNTGYYRYDAGYTPEFEGSETFAGRIVHPQLWPEDLDCSGKRIVVIGSGATVVTLVPALAQVAAHVTMLQRSPSYIASFPDRDPMDEALRRRLSPGMAGFLVRWRNVAIAWLIFQLSRHAPKFMRGVFQKGVVSQLPAGFDVETHFTPTYEPWDQRLCLAPGGDIFGAISEGRASVVTDRIVRFTPGGIELESGSRLEADVIVTATGLNLLMLGGMSIEVDGRPVDLAETVSYKSLMLCGVPNLAFTFGYTNSSWTLKSDLAARYVCRLLKAMDRGGYAVGTPMGPALGLPTAPYLDLSSGYVRRGEAAFPRQGTKAPWRVRHNYLLDALIFRWGPVDDQMAFAGPGPEAGSSTLGAMRPIFHLSLPVRDLDEAVSFYGDELGARIGRRTTDFADALVFGAQVTLQNDPASVSDPMPWTRHFGATLPWDEWESVTERLSRSATVVEARTISYTGKPIEQGKMMIQDPSGNLIEIKAYRHPEEGPGIVGRTGTAWS